MARRIRAAVEKQKIVVPGLSTTLSVTTSIGVAVAEAGRMTRGLSASEETASLLTRADRALYRAKRTGRNRVVSDLNLISRPVPTDTRKVSGM